MDCAWDSAFLLPPDLRDWISEDDLAHFVIGAVERATHRDTGVCLVVAIARLDHDTIAAFRRESFAAVAESFLQILLLAKELNIAKVGVVSVDGTKIDANGRKRQAKRNGSCRSLLQSSYKNLRGL